MGLLERARYIVSADLEQLVSRGRDPQLVLDGYLEDLEQVLEETQRIRTGEESELELLSAQARDVRSAMGDMEKKASRCLQSGDEPLARAALSRKLELEAQAAELEEQVAERRRHLELIDGSIEALEARLRQVRQVRRRLRLRKQLLEARSTLQQAVARVRDRDGEMLGETAEDLVELEGALEAEEAVAGEELESRFRREEVAADRQRRTQRLEQELERLKKQLRSGDGKKG